MKTPAPTPAGVNADSWPMLGGDPSRGRISTAAGRIGAKQRQIPLAKNITAIPMPPPIRRQLQSEHQEEQLAGLTLGVIPVVDHSQLFFQDNACIYARNIESGLPLPGWLATYPGDQDGRYSTGMTAMPPDTQETVTVTDHDVLAVIRQFDQIPAQNFRGGIINLQQASGETKLVCLDRTSGAERWSVSPRQFPNNNLKDLEFGASPVVIGDNVYINACGGKPMQFEDSYVLCLNLADGRLCWSCYLASGNALGTMNMMLGQSTLGTDASHIACDGGRIYVSTELGAIAAVDAYTGQIVWLDLYPRPQQNFAALQAGIPQPGNTPAKPWTVNPVIVKDGKVFAMPSDSTDLLIYDAGTGDEIKRIPMRDFDNAQTLLGVTGDRVIVNSNTSVYCINWKDYNPATPADAQLFWRTGPLVNPSVAEALNRDTIRGRGFVTADSVFVTTQWRLHRISMRNGKTEQTYPANMGLWAADEGPGNLLVTPDHVVIAGADSVDIYTDMALARRRLDEAVAAHPHEPGPNLEYAEVMFASGQMDVALAKLDEAIDLLGGLHSMRPGTDRDRVFADALAFAQRLSDPRNNSPARIAQANPMFDRAGAAAYTPQQQVSYRQSRADFAHAQHDFATELELYQEILSHPDWRKVIVNREGASPAPAWVVAERAVTDLVRSRRDLYAPYEKLAASAFAAALSAHDPEQLKAVAQVYPVAKVAPDALFAAAEACELAGKHREATRVLNHIYRKYLDVDKARVIEAQARNYLALPHGVEIAIGRLLEGAKLPGNPRLTRPLTLPDGTVLRNESFADAAAALQTYSLKVASAALPDFHIKPTANGEGSVFAPENPHTIISDIDRLLVPDRELRHNRRNDRVVTWTGGKGMAIYAVGNNQPLGTNPRITDAPKGIAWTSQNDLVVWSAEAGGRLTLLAGDNAQTRWELSVRTLPKLAVTLEEPAPDQVMAIQNPQPAAQQAQVIMAQRLRARQLAQQAIGAANQIETIDHVLPIGDRIIVGTSTGRVMAVDLATGDVAWQTRITELGIDQLLASDDFVAIRFVGDGGAEIVALDAANGQVVMHKVFGQQPPQNMALSPDGTLVWSMPDRIYGKDLYEPEKGLKFGAVSMNTGGTTYNGAIAADQLVVADGRILALSDSGQMVRVLSLETGREVAAPIATRSAANTWNVWLRVLGPRLYIISGKTVCERNLTDADDSWDGSVDIETPVMSQAFFGKNYVVLLGQVTPANVPIPGAARNWLTGYSRRVLDNGKESGVLDFSQPVTNPAGIDQWQPVEGGFYYHSLDHKLHYLNGTAGDGNHSSNRTLRI